MAPFDDSVGAGCGVGVGVGADTGVMLGGDAALAAFDFGVGTEPVDDLMGADEMDL